MLLTAQRVISPGGIQGVNAFRYSHPDGYGSVTRFDELERSARLRMQELEVPPGGNRVRSYLDLLAADATGIFSLVQWAKTALCDAPPQSLPFVETAGEFAIRFCAE